MSSLFSTKLKVSTEFQWDASADVVLPIGDCLELLRPLPDEIFDLVVSSPPYNVGKAYEQRQAVDEYLAQMQPVLMELHRVLKPTGSLCWQVGNYVDRGKVFPLDCYYYPLFKNLGLQLRNRIIWRFGHGLHASKRFSGRYETLLWFTKSPSYKFNLDAVRGTRQVSR